MKELPASIMPSFLATNNKTKTQNVRHRPRPRPRPRQFIRSSRNRFDLPHLCTVAIDIVYSRRPEKHQALQLHRPGYRDGAIPFEKLDGVQESGDCYLPRDKNKTQSARRTVDEITLRKITQAEQSDQ